MKPLYHVADLPRWRNVTESAIVVGIVVFIVGHVVLVSRDDIVVCVVVGFVVRCIAIGVDTVVIFTGVGAVVVVMAAVMAVAAVVTAAAVVSISSCDCRQHWINRRPSIDFGSSA